MSFIIFRRDDCCFCDKAEKLLKEKKENLKIVNFEHSQMKVFKEIQDTYDWKTAPMIFKRKENDIKFIGGYSDLVEFFENDG